MPDISVDVQVIIADGDLMVGLAPTDINRILNSPVFRPDKPKIVRKPNPAFSASIDPVEKLTPADVQASATLGLDISIKMADIVRERAKHFSMAVDPIKNSDIYQACRAIYGLKFKGIVTFDMYEKLLYRFRTSVNQTRTA